MPNTDLQISEVAHLLGITPKAIRHYHAMGLLDEPARAANGYRMYDVQSLNRLQLILRLQKLGLTLKQIRAILEVDEPDDLLQQLLLHRTSTLSDEIARLQREQAEVEQFLQSGTTVAEWAKPNNAVSSQVIIHDELKPVASGLTDVLFAVEGDILRELDGYQWPDGYAQFWVEAARSLTLQIKRDEHLFILWLERYLALGDMAEDDRQAQAWLSDIQNSRARWVLAQAFVLPASEVIAEVTRRRLQRLLVMSLYERGNGLQQALLTQLIGE